MDEEKPSRWQRLQKLSFNKKLLSKRMRRAEGVTMRHARRFIVRRWSNAREVQRHIIIWVTAVGLIIVATGLQLMWNQQNYRTTTTALNGTYAEAVLGPVDTLNPLYAASSAELSASQLIFSKLFTYDTSGHLADDLASGMSVDGTGKVYTIKLRAGVRWQDGVALSAKDVAFTFGLIKNPSVRSTITGWNDITVTVLDDNTVQFTVPAVYAAFPQALAGVPILPEHILSKVTPNTLRENDFSQAPIGTGPFSLQLIQDIDLTTGRKIIHLARNTDYYGGPAKLDRFQLHVYGTRDEIIKALSNGEVSASPDLSATNASLMNQTRYDVRTSPIDSGVYALFNTTSDFLKDKSIRQALQRGTNVKAIRAKLPITAPGLDLPFINGEVTGDVPKVAPYDAAVAASILDADGWKLDGTTRKKNGIELKLNVVTTKDADYERVLEELVTEWRKLGIIVSTLVVDPTDPSQHVTQDILQKRNYDVLLYQLTIGADPDVYAYWHSSQAYPNRSGFNFSNYANAISDDALSSARSRLEPGLRNAKYIAFARQWIADIPAIGLYQSTEQYVSSKIVIPYASSNVLVNPADRYADILYWSDSSRDVYRTP
jgi:peptide/nickel transport system substrate-binding protein